MLNFVLNYHYYPSDSLNLKMNKLPMCRICLVENVRMDVVVNKHLHEVYEKLTDIPFVTEDSRPILACYVCCALLKKCYRLRTKCLEAEERFAQIMNGNYEPNPSINQDQLELFHGFINTPIQSINIVDVGQNEIMIVKEELPTDFQRLEDIIEPKEEHLSDDGLDTKNLYDNYLEIEYIPPHHSGPDLEDDVPLMTLKTEAEEEQGVSENKRKAKKTNRASVVKKPKIFKQRTKLEDAITEQIKKTQKSNLNVIRSTEIRTSKRGTYFIEPSKCNQHSLKRETKLEQRTRAQICKKLYTCDVCQHSFSRKNTLKSHIRLHTGEKPYKCNVCQRGFSRNNALTRHVRTHSGEKPFKCDLCSRNFTNKSSLSRHNRLHAGDKPYKCIVCQHSFSQKYHLKRHTIIHTGEKQRQCDICQRTFRHEGSLRNHIRIHTGEKPYKCDLCPRSFSKEGSLRNHIRIHTGEKPFKCDLCWRSFRNKSFIAKHIRKHAGEKPYKCYVCERSYVNMGNLRKHIRIHSNKLETL